MANVVSVIDSRSVLILRTSMGCEKNPCGKATD
jgi:hypothetical protein